jgi:hypothetical protein
MLVMESADSIALDHPTLVHSSRLCGRSVRQDAPLILSCGPAFAGTMGQ